MTKIVVSENTKKIDVLKLKGIKAVNDVDPNEVVDDDFIGGVGFVKLVIHAICVGLVKQPRLLVIVYFRQRHG